MRSLHFPGRVIAVVVVLALALSGRGALAQTQERVDEAMAGVDGARAVLDGARAMFDRLLADRDLAIADLDDAFAQYSLVNRALERAALEALLQRERVLGAEQELRGLRRSVEEIAVRAYMDGGIDLSAVFDAESLHGVATAGWILEQAVARDEETMYRFAEATAGLGEIRSEYQQRREDLEGLEAEAERVVRWFELLLDRAQARARGAGENLRAAAGAYRVALEELEDARRRRAGALGVLEWRPLVRQYFPDDRVDQALWVIHCESRGDPNATNPTSGAAGLFQFLDGTWRTASSAAGFAGASPYDPEAAVASAAWLVEHTIGLGHPNGPWAHWACRP